MKNRDKLIHYAIKYNGDYQKVLKAFNNNENVDSFLLCENAITIFDEIYPSKLNRLCDPPLVLFYKGNIQLINSLCISIVGSRKITPYTFKIMNNIVQQLSNRYTIVSGLAMGVDSLAHQIAINKSTIAIIGCGIDYVYPLCNKGLYQKMSENQLILSEYPYKTLPMKHHFPFRNRIIAALSDKLIVAQATTLSGTMHTVNHALEINNDIYVIPQPFDDEMGKGSNQLIKEGANILLTDDIEML